MPSLFDPLIIGNWHLKNRVVMAPLTRCRAAEHRTPNELMAQYYAQRASAGLILSEATSVTPMGVGYADTPGIWSDAQVVGWRKITDSVHAAGSIILLQLWHVGRVSDPIFLDGKQPVAPSAIAASGHVSLIRPPKAFVVPRALELAEIAGVVADYRRGAENAQKAGFDGVEIHGANGYLLDQFLQDSSNHRTDRYGGSLENRARLMLEVADACVDVWGAPRVGLHLSPRGDSHSMGDSNLTQTFSYVAREAGKRGLAFLCARVGLGEKRIGPILRREFVAANPAGKYIANEGFTRETAQQVIDADEADAVAFGKLFIANPDLPLRLQQNAPLNPPRPELFYAPGPAGYVDYPALEPQPV